MQKALSKKWFIDADDQPKMCKGFSYWGLSGLERKFYDYQKAGDMIMITESLLNSILGLPNDRLLQLRERGRPLVAFEKEFHATAWYRKKTIEAYLHAGI